MLVAAAVNQAVSMTTEQLTNEASQTLRLREAKLRDEAQSQLQEQQRRLEEAKA